MKTLRDTLRSKSLHGTKCSVTDLRLESESGKVLTFKKRPQS